MPGPIAHHFTARWVAQELARSGRIPADTLGTAAPFLHFGSQGPDFLFFNAKDWPADGVGDAVEFFLQVYGWIEELRESIRNVLPLDKIDQAIAAGKEESTVVKQIVESFEDTRAVTTAIERTLTTAIEAFTARAFSSAIFSDRIGHPEQRVKERYKRKPAWWWFDTLHYKRTGRFARALMRNALRGGGNDEIAYATGYLTHYAADIVGHPYINILSGGPYRTHSQRHKVIENYHDTDLYNRYVPGGDLPSSHLFEQYLLGGSFARPELPRNLSALISGTMREVYPDRPSPRYGRVPDHDNLQGAYHLWMLWFRRATSVLDGLRPPEPYNLTDELADALSRFEREMREIADLVSRPFRGGFNILAVFEFLAALAVAFLEFFRALGDFIIGSGLTIALAPLRALLSVAYEALYNLFMTFYEMVALSGLAFPFLSMTRRPQVLHFLNPKLDDSASRNAASYAPGQYPLKIFRPGDLFNEAHLIYPFPGASLNENDRTNIGPSEYLSSDVSYYLEQAGSTVARTYEFLSGITSSRLGELQSAVFSANNTLGSARQFSLFLFEELQAGRALPDFNLDGDRGYGFKSWRLKESTLEMPGTEDDFAAIQQIEENPDRHVPNTLMNIL